VTNATYYGPFVFHPLFHDDSFSCRLSETSVILLYFQCFASPPPPSKYPSGKEGSTLYLEAPGIWAVTVFRIVLNRQFLTTDRIAFSFHVFVVSISFISSVKAEQKSGITFSTTFIKHLVCKYQTENTARLCFVSTVLFASFLKCIIYYLM
jgi:hypothetical protein